MELAKKAGAHAYLPLGKSGFLGGLWMMAEASGTGLKLDMRRIPVLQHTIEVCEVTGENPYMIPSGGSLLLALKSGEAFCSELRRRGIPAECCGQANTSNDRLLYSGEITRYLDKPPKELRPGFNPAGAGAEQEKK
jgi:hydrogenase maturation factor